MEPLLKWSHVETEVLIAVGSEEKIHRDLQESLRNEKMSGRLVVMGMYCSAEQCREKIEKLKYNYWKIK